MELQPSFVQAEHAGKKKQTRRERFLGEMERVVLPPQDCGGSGADKNCDVPGV